MLIFIEGSESEKATGSESYVISSKSTFKVSFDIKGIFLLKQFNLFTAQGKC